MNLFVPFAARLARSVLASWMALCCMITAHPVTAREDAAWDVTQPRGKTREIDFETREGTWMSLDLTPDGRWVVFDLLGHVYRVPASGGEAQCLTQDSGIALNAHPRVSPDGRSIAFVSDRKDNNGLWVMDLDGRNPRAVAIDEAYSFFHPEWSADGRYLYAERFGTLEDRPNSIWMFNRDGGQGKQVVGPADGSPARPVASADGRFLYHELSTWRDIGRDILQGEIQLAQVDLATGAQRLLTSGISFPARLTSGGAYAQEVSPDGRWLSFVRRIPDGTVTYKGHTFGPRSALWLRDVASGAERLLMDPVELDLAEAMLPVADGVFPRYRWARDGRSIVILQGGKMRRVDVATGRVSTISFTAPVRRTISEQPLARFKLSDGPMQVRYTQWQSRSPDGTRLLFQAAGRIWIKKLPDGSPVRLTPSDFEPLEYAPAWSPDGRSIAFVTFDGSNRGHLWKSSAAGTTPTRLSREPAEYFNPVFSPDGKQIVAVRGYGVTASGYALATSKYFDLVRTQVAGGAITALTRIDWPGSFGSYTPIPRPSFGPDGRIFFPVIMFSSEPPFRMAELVSVRPDGSDRRKHAQFVNSNDVTPSPDGRWAAFVHAGDVYLTALPYQGAGTTVPRFDKRGGAAPVKRLTTLGGLFPTWRNATTLDFGSGPRAYHYEVGTERVETTEINLEVSRDVAAGSLALTGARIVTLENKQVIERGTIVVRNARIACVGTCSTSGVDRVIDVDGATIVPGWIDMHAHHHYQNAGFPAPRNFNASAYLAYGVTTTLDPAAWSPEVFGSAELVEAGEMIGPRMFTTGEQANAGDGMGTNDIDTFEVALQEVARRKDWGAVSFKQYGLPRRKQRQWSVEAARRSNLRVTSEGFSDLLMRLSLVMDGHTAAEHALGVAPLYSDVTRFLGAAHLFHSHTPQITGPAAMNEQYFWQESQVWKDPKAQRWLPWRQLIPHTRRPTLRPVTDYSAGLLAQGLADIIEAGGYGALGSHGHQHGIGSHWDIWIAAMAMSPMQALEVASVHGAKMLGMEEDLGSIAPGKLADLVVLNANPLDNIRNTTNMRFVMKAGVLYEAASLDQIWPRQRKFGDYHWVVPEMLRADDKPIDVWDRQGQPSAGSVSSWRPAR